MRGLACCTALLTAGVRITPAQTGLLVVAHGADSGWNARVRETVAQVHWSQGPVALAFLMGSESESAGWGHAVDALLAARATSIVVVPFLVSSFGGHYREIEYYAGRRDSLSGHVLMLRHHPLPVPSRVTSALDAAPELGQALVALWRGLTDADRSRPLVLVAHGPADSEDAARWLANLRTAAAALPSAGLATPLGIGLLWDDATPPLRAAAVAALRDTVNVMAVRARDSVVVIPVLISSGSIDQQKLPRDLLGLPIHYRPASLAPLPALARWIERAGAEAR